MAQEHGFSGAVLLARGDEILLSEGYGFAERKSKKPNTPDTLFDIGSVTKPFTATAVLILEQQGKLSLSDALGRFFEGVPEDKKNVTVRHLLSHTSGLPYVELDDMKATREEFVRTAMAAEMRAAPGEDHYYTNTGYQLLAAIVEKASGMGFEEFVGKEVFAKSGMSGATFCQTDPSKDRPDSARRYPDGESLDDSGSACYWAYGWGFRGSTGLACSVKDLHRFARTLDKRMILN